MKERRSRTFAPAALASPPAKDSEMVRGLPAQSSMKDSTVKKVSSEFSPKGTMGQKYLVSGKSVSMRLWDHEKPGDKSDEPTAREYETVGFVIDGRAELEIEGQTILLERGDSWLVPKGAKHRYKILEEFTAVEATTPPAEVHARDERSI